MGAKQSKRSVDISGKEADGAGEVAAAGAGGEGRMEQLADADALKPQLNGDAHIHEQTDKEKELDSGTPENEKDATTEKETKDHEDDKEKELTPVSNGEGDQKTENGESTTPTEEGKKPKKEKVKKKWSLRSISFSRKDKPKQEKKQKEEEPKTNGEPEKVPEETVVNTLESPVNEVVEEVQQSVEAKDEKAPETPVTEPITNGSATPESSKVETPAADESVIASPENDRPEPKCEIEPEQLPVNGLSIVDPIPEMTEVESKIEETPENKTETTDVVTVPEIPTIKEVCVTQLPLIEPSPPPLPSNPPPSSVASFAATTMAPELTAALLSNTDSAITPQLSALDVEVTQNKSYPDSPPNLNVIETITNEPTSVVKKLTEKTPENITNDKIVEIPPNNIYINPEIIPDTLKMNITSEELIIHNEATAAANTEQEKAEIDSITFETDKKEVKENEVDIIISHEKDAGITITTDINVVDNTKERETAIKDAADIIQVAEIDEKENAIKIVADDTIEVVDIDLKKDKIIGLDDVIRGTNTEQEYNAVVMKNNDAKSHEINDSKCVQEVDTNDLKENINIKNDNCEDINKLCSVDPLPKAEICISTNVEISITEPAVVISDDIDDLPPPPPIDEVEIHPNEGSQKIEDIPELITQTNEVSNVVETYSSDALVDDKVSDEILKETVEAIEPVQCNGPIDALMTKDIPELTPINSTLNENMPSVECGEEIAMVEEKCMPLPVLEDTDSMGETADVDSKRLPVPVAELCQTELPSPPSSLDVLPDTPQDLVSEKMADLISEVPTVPELKTETLQETSNDVVVAN